MTIGSILRRDEGFVFTVENSERASHNDVTSSAYLQRYTVADKGVVHDDVVGSLALFDLFAGTHLMMSAPEPCISSIG